MADKDVVVIPMTDDSPEVRLDKKNWKIKIFGPSFPEDPVDFYNQIIKWMEINQDNFDELTVEFDFTILSSSSNKMIFEIFLKLEELQTKGKKVKVNWYYAHYDEDMYDEGKSFKNSMRVPVELIEKKEQNNGS